MNRPFDDFVAPPCAEQIEILFQDEHILLINKPSGLLSLSGKNPLNQDSVHYRLVQQFPSATMIHRLDFGTSGIMVLALNKNANAHLTKQFQSRNIEKTYTSILEGHINQEHGVIELPIAKGLFPRQKICNKEGKVAISHYKVLEQLHNPDRTRVIFTPETGRTHQLRIHSQSIGHPILGCDLYTSEHTQSKAKRLMLHATTLAFTHPQTGKPIKGHCACPF